MVSSQQDLATPLSDNKSNAEAVSDVDDAVAVVGVVVFLLTLS